MANELGFYGENNIEKSIIDQVGETIIEVLPAWVELIYTDMKEDEKVYFYYKFIRIKGSSINSITIIVFLVR